MDESRKGGLKRGVRKRVILLRRIRRSPVHHGGRMPEMRI